MAGCTECGNPLGRNPKLAIFSLSLGGPSVSAPHCAACWEAVKTRGGPGPNAYAHASHYSNAATSARRARTLVQGG